MLLGAAMDHGVNVDDSNQAIGAAVGYHDRKSLESQQWEHSLFAIQSRDVTSGKQATQCNHDMWPTGSGG